MKPFQLTVKHYQTEKMLPQHFVYLAFPSKNKTMLDISIFTLPSVSIFDQCKMMIEVKCEVFDEGEHLLSMDSKVCIHTQTQTHRHTHTCTHAGMNTWKFT